MNSDVETAIRQLHHDLKEGKDVMERLKANAEAQQAQIVILQGFAQDLQKLMTGYAERAKQVEDLLNDTDEALYWLLNLLHGNSKGGPDYNPPGEEEWKEATEEGEKAHERVKAWRLEQHQETPF